MSLRELEQALQDLPPPKNDNPELQALFENIKNSALPFGNIFKSSWLISDFYATEWTITVGKSYLDEQGVWRRTKKISWDVILPNGMHLTDRRYHKLLDACRKIVFLHRQGFATNNAPPAMTVWQEFINNILSLAQWLVLEEERYEPESYGFLLLDQSGIDLLTRKLAIGGWVYALRTPERIISFLYESSIGQKCPPAFLKHPFTLPEENIQTIMGWVRAQGGYSNTDGSENGLINRSFLAKKIHTRSSALASPKLSAILRQFEPLLSDPALLLKGTQTTEFPSHRTQILTEVLESTQTKSSFNSSSGSLISFFNLYRHLPECIPSPSLFNIARSRQAASHLCGDAGHTPFIPTQIAFSYLNTALTWINLGDDLITFYLQVLKKILLQANISKAKGSKNYWSDSVSRFSEDILENTPLPESLQLNGFNFEKFTVAKINGWSFESFRKKPSLTEALEVWVGAVVILIGLLKPSRDLEITSLTKDCLLKDESGNYWLNSILAKRTVGEYHTNTDGKPIPFMTAKAIQQMNRLGTELKMLFEEAEAYNLQRLFYLPSTTKPGTCKDVINESLNYYLDKFCDYVGLPPDELGRRWYIRIHEMRKWFLLMFFWSGRYDVMDAGRSIAGHTDVGHLQAYTSREFPRDQLGELEAEWVIDQLVDLEGKSDPSVNGLVELRNNILNNFGAKNLNCIEERQWHRYVQTLLEEQYHIEPFTFVTNLSEVICVAIRAVKVA